ncbi:Long-chain fatty acid transport protein [Desulfocicer vacuolatum DSM 3385]|uniref:Long-chain fatty acid transport protein n=1 Tax=Desulfocicer vacuolatum DSM 3385 TaxID=1121400 RepID=A0A1W2EKU0_9BACT|nr:outer membrane protein transport protein [Desulfocicer vacuolatum]SMD09896.1 Long-chain fatty acid transport protein [Desulfocicer vacuolatum DSM 3385]
MKKNIPLLLVSFLLVFLNFYGVSRASYGYFLHGAGAVNDSLGGAATAGNKQDLLGSLYRNPANATLFEGRIASVSVGAVFPDATINSSVSALGMTGSSDSTVDVIPLSNLGVVFNDKTRPMAYYFAIIGEAGLHLDLPQSFSNPICVSQAGKSDNPYGGAFGGFGAIETQMEVVRIPFGASYQIDNKWALGFSVGPSVARLKFSPAAFAAPDDANGDGIYTYPTGVDHELAFGVGFQAGVRCQATDKLGIGFTFTSPTWFNDFKWDVTDENGNSRTVSHHVDRPLTLHLGLSYQATPGTIFVMDCSWINYSGTKGFDEIGFDSNGSLKGLGWDDQWTVALGVQHDILVNWTIRAGYNYGTNPIDDDITFHNVGNPLHNEHHLSCGLSWKVTEQMSIDLGYTHAFETSQSGSWYDATNQAVPGTEIESSLVYDQVAVGLTFLF